MRFHYNRVVILVNELLFMRILLFVVVALSYLSLAPSDVAADEPDRRPFRIEVREKGSSWPIPLVEFRTTDQIRFVTDNAGVVAFDLPDRMGRETWLSVSSPGYEAAADGFGLRGVRVTPRPGESITVELARTAIARRVGRLTGSGLFAESQKCGLEEAWRDSPITGCDSVRMVRFQDKYFWNWGDTSVSKYPLGNFAMTGATTAGAPFDSLEPPLRPRYEYFLTPQGAPAPMADIPGPGPTWLGGYAVLADDAGREHLVALYQKIEPPLAVYEVGLCEFDGTSKQFLPVKKLWNKLEGGAEPKRIPIGHTVSYVDEQKKRWMLYGDPFPKFKIEARYEHWIDPSRWISVEAPNSLEAASSKEKVQPHTGSIAYSPYRKAWVTVFMQNFGKPSAFGELWYGEAKSPLGPWGKAVKVLSHENYTFYNPRLLAEFTPEGKPILLFEGTYTEQFANKPVPTARYDYNQLLYRLDLDDLRLAPCAAGSE
jgi:hypothetical protein